MTVHLLSAGAAKGLVTSVTAQFLAATGHRLAATFGAVGVMLERLNAGDDCDVIILSRRMIDDLDRALRVHTNSIADLGRVRTGVAVLQGAASPQVGHADALRAALRGASAIYIPDPQRATAGMHFMKVLSSLGLTDEVQARLRPFANGATAMAEMAQAHDPRSIGVTQVTEILYSPGVTLVAALPPEFELATVYSAAVTSGATQRDAALTLISQLVSDAMAPTRSKGGFEPC